MAALKPEAAGAEAPEREVVTVDVGGHGVQVDLTYMRSWPGIKQAARINSQQLGEEVRFLAMVEHFAQAIPNNDELYEAVEADAAAKGEPFEPGALFAMFNEAVGKAIPKN